jgi:hypothetical protein
MGTHFLEEPAAFIFGLDSSTLKMEAEGSSDLPNYMASYPRRVYTKSKMLHKGKSESIHIMAYLLRARTVDSPF